MRSSESARTQERMRSKMHTESSHCSTTPTETKIQEQKQSSRRFLKPMQCFQMTTSGKDTIPMGMWEQRKYSEDLKRILMKSLKTWALVDLEIYSSKYLAAVAALVALISEIHLAWV